MDVLRFCAQQPVFCMKSVLSLYYMNKKNLPIIIALALPILFVVIITGVLFVPTLSLKPSYNFIYSSNNGYYPYYMNIYKVNDQKQVTMEPNPSYNATNSYGYNDSQNAPNLYMYDIITNTVKQITLEEAQRYVVDPGPSSPDGYQVNYNYNNNGIFEIFGGGSRRSGYVISKGSASKALPAMVGDAYYGSYTFIGWIIK